MSKNLRVGFLVAGFILSGCSIPQAYQRSDTFFLFLDITTICLCVWLLWDIFKGEK